MPVNAPAEYFAAEEKFKSAKSRNEKIAAMEEMLRLLPKHHGSEQANAQLKAKLAKLRKETSGRKGFKKIGIEKEGEAQVCILGLTNSGKSTLLKNLTNAEPKISEHPFTTTKPEIGMMDYDGVKIQIIEIPSTFSGEFMGVARTADLLVLLARTDDEEEGLKKLLRDNFIRTKHITVNDSSPDAKEKIWDALGLMLVYTKKTNTPMALPKGAVIADFASRIHKDFLKNFRFARVWRRGRLMHAGLKYRLESRDTVELYLG